MSVFILDIYKLRMRAPINVKIMVKLINVNPNTHHPLCPILTFTQRYKSLCTKLVVLRTGLITDTPRYKQ